MQFARSHDETRSVFANDKFVKLKQDVTRQRERDLRIENASYDLFLNFKREKERRLSQQK